MTEDLPWIYPVTRGTGSQWVKKGRQTGHSAKTLGVTPSEILWVALESQPGVDEDEMPGLVRRAKAAMPEPARG